MPVLLRANSVDDKKEGKLLRKTLESVDALLAESRRLVSVKKLINVISKVALYLFEFSVKPFHRMCAIMCRRKTRTQVQSQRQRPIGHDIVNIRFKRT